MAFFAKKAEVGRQVLQLPIGMIAPNPNQPRRTFSPAELEELSLSIAQVGILQPLTVRALEDGWELVAGERRLRAAALARTGDGTLSGYPGGRSPLLPAGPG